MLRTLSFSQLLKIELIVMIVKIVSDVSLDSIRFYG